MKAILLDEAKKWLEENCENLYTRMAVFGLMQGMPTVDYQEEPNEPLTIEQLREMDGQPVWVECLNSKKYISPPVGWRILEKSITGHIGVWDGENCLIELNYGTDWLAYTYHPAHIDREAWVSVEERLPEDEKDGEIVLVIVFGKPHENITLHGAIMTAGYFQDEGWVLNEYPEWEGPEITHWMPLPNPPAELEKRIGVI